jgi:hypothetical protein
MFLRRCHRGKNGKQHIYWALVESIRTAVGSRQRVVAYLGELAGGEQKGCTCSGFCYNDSGTASLSKAGEDEPGRTGPLTVPVFARAAAIFDWK